MKRILIALACIFFLSTLCFGQSEIDRCEALVPSGLKTAIKKDYPTYRIARVSDYPTETIKDQRGVYPNHPCLAVASTDVDGDGFNDYALFIVEPSGHTLLIAGRNIGGKIW